MSDTLLIDADFPGGNIILEKIDGDVVFLRQDLRDTEGNWFYWAFRVRGESALAGRTLTFRFTDGDVIGSGGPVVSFDGGDHWHWLGEACVSRGDGTTVAFTYTFPPNTASALIAFCPLYTQREFDAFLGRHAGDPRLRRESLCRTRSGREAELLTLVESDSSRFRLLLTARHHACEAMGSYCLEGLLDAAMAGDELGTWFRRHVNLAAVPFMDKDGVEAGDQGKNRRPYDHNRDYGGEPADSIYREVQALRRWAPAWLAEGKPSLVLDLHCPWIRSGRNEEVYFVGSSNPEIWRRVCDFSAALEATSTGTLRHEARNNLPFGCEWNTINRGNAIGGRTCAGWGNSLPGVHFATTLEVPYAIAGGVEVTPDRARALGRDLAAGLRAYLETVATNT